MKTVRSAIGYVPVPALFLNRKPPSEPSDTTEIGLCLGNKGPGATRDLIRDCTRAAEALPVDHVWVYDHIVIPREDSESSGGLYMDSLATLAFVAGATERVGIGTGILDLPYRPPLPTAEWLASIQELSEGCLLLGVGAGWMETEFRALDVERRRRGAITDETLKVIHRCFADDEVELNSKRFLFLSWPTCPPIHVGGRSPQAAGCAATLGDGWFPNMAEPEELHQPIEELRRQARARGGGVRASGARRRARPSQSPRRICGRPGHYSRGEC